MSAPSDGARADARKRLAAADSSQSAVVFIRALVGAWDCCGTCAGGVLATRDRELIADAKAEALREFVAVLDEEADQFCDGCESCDGNTRFGLTIAAKLARDEATQ